MAPHKTITVNGRVYDAVTGLPLDAPTASAAKAKQSAAPKPASAAASSLTAAARPSGAPRPDVVKMTPTATAPKVAAPKPASHTARSTASAESVHSTMQRSQTLNRRATKKPTPTNRPITRRPVAGRQMDIAKSGDVTRFAKHPVTTQSAQPAATVAASKPTPVVADKPAQSHPLAARAMARNKKAPTPVAKKPSTAKEVKNAAIDKAMATPTQKPAKDTEPSKSKLRKLIIIVAIILVVAGALFAAYRLFPSISVGIASAQAGISATYPEFTPDGYSLSQPVTYGDGRVELKFHSNSNDNYYTVTQTRSSWDPSAVLDKVVTPEAGAAYVTTKERGLTIYTYDSVATWVNGGIMYKIDSKAPLSGDQIRRIATSL